MSEFYKNVRRKDGLSCYCKACQKEEHAKRSFDPAPVTHLACSTCKANKPVSQFNLRRMSKTGYTASCKACLAIGVSRRDFVVTEDLKKKVCGRCKKEQPINQFCKNKGSADGLNFHCKVCIKETALKRKYAMTADVYWNLFDQQKGKCAICGVHEKTLGNRSDRPKVLAVDHCHESGEIRGLLCGKCNMGIGLLGDTLQDLINAVRYLEKEKGSGRSNSQTRTRVNGMAKASTSRRGR